MLAIDTRSLALLRVGVASIILLDLVSMRLPDVAAFYADSGMVPIALSQGWCALPGHWSLHELHGSAAYQTGLLGCEVLAGGLLLTGCFTRTATIVSWVLAVSLANRNPLVCNYGDTIVQLLLFWSIWLPWGETWSVDAWRKSNCAAAPMERRRVASVATACALLQLCLLYFFAGLWKLNDDWLSGSAVAHALALEYAVRGAAEYLQGFPALLSLLTRGTLFLELFGPLLVWVPWRTEIVRLALVVAFILLHVGIELFFTPLYLSHVCIVAWSLFLPGIFWELPGVRNLSIAWDRAIRNRRQQRQEMSSAGELQVNPPSVWSWRLGRMVNTVLMILLGYVVLWNVATFDSRRLGFLLPEQARWTGHALMLRQTWDMFWIPSRFNGWIEVRAKRADGTTVDVLGNERVVPSKTPSPNWKFMPNSRWKVFFRRLAENPDSAICQEVLDYQWRKWNLAHQGNQRAVRMDLVFIRWRDGDGRESGDVAERIVCRVEAPEANSLEDMLQRLRNQDDGFPLRP